jgi:hypothetical protein
VSAQVRGFVVACIAAACVLHLPAASAQPVGDRQGNQAVFLSTDARAAALGDAVGALPGGLAAAPMNPGALAWLPGFAMEFTFHRLSPEASLEHLAAGFRIDRRSVLGLHLTMVHHGDFNFLSRSDLRALGFELRGGATWASDLGEDLSCGLTVDVLNATTDADPVWAVAGSAGLAYAPGRYHRFGFAIRNWGTDYAINSPVVAPGVSDVRPERAVSLSAVLDFPLAADRQRLVIAFENDKLIGRPGILYCVGLEYRPFATLALRTGAQVRSEDVEPRAGAGLAFGSLSLDYAWRCLPGGAPAHVVTLAYSPVRE